MTTTMTESIEDVELWLAEKLPGLRDYGLGESFTMVVDHAESKEGAVAYSNKIAKALEVEPSLSRGWVPNVTVESLLLALNRKWLTSFWCRFYVSDGLIDCYLEPRALDPFTVEGTGLTVRDALIRAAKAALEVG